MTSLLDGPHARGAFLIRSILNPPFSVRIADQAPLCLVTMVRGQAWMIPDHGEATLLRLGDVAIVCGPELYTIADSPGTPVRSIIHPGQRCTDANGEDLSDEMVQGPRAWGDDADGSTVMLSGTYRMNSEIGRRLLGALPPVLVRHARLDGNPLLPLLAAEIGKTEPGQELVLDRLLDLLLVTVTRDWLADPQSGAPEWFRVQEDHVVGPALRMLHDNPAHDWTVAKLAAQIGVSRAALARRFTTLVGEPPMMYLTHLRLTLAADLLREPNATVAAVARRVGYGSSFALSTAFKRVLGVSPQEHRKSVLHDVTGPDERGLPGVGQKIDAVKQRLHPSREALAVAT